MLHNKNYTYIKFYGLYHCFSNTRQSFSVEMDRGWGCFVFCSFTHENKREFSNENEFHVRGKEAIAIVKCEMSNWEFWIVSLFDS